MNVNALLPEPGRRIKYSSYCHGCGVAGMKGAMKPPDGEPCPKCKTIFCLDCLPRHYFWTHVKQARKLYGEALRNGRLVK